MYFDFEDYRPDITPVGRAISWREGVLLSIIVHLAMIVLLLAAPQLFPQDLDAARARAAAAVRPVPEENTRFVFVQPRVDVPSPTPPERGEAADRDRMARARERAANPTNPLPFARGNSPERVEEIESRPPRGRGPEPDPAEGREAANTPPAETPQQRLPESQSAMVFPNERMQPPMTGAGGAARTPGGSLGDALRNLERYVQRESFDNVQGGGQFGPELQFDTRGVEFGPWVRRFIAQVKRNWFIPYAAMSMKGHVVITFNVHKNGAITDLTIVEPSLIEAFNNAAYGALAASNPTQPLPLEYPADRAFFTVTFFYNETPQ